MTVSNILVYILCSFVGTIGYAMIYNVPRKYYIGCGFTGMAGWMTYLLVGQADFMTNAVASFCGTFVVVLISRILTVHMKCPITIFLISGILPLVPGAGVYNTAYNLVVNRYSLAQSEGIEALKVAFAIVMAIVIVVSIPRDAFGLSYWRKRRAQRKARKLEPSK